MGSKPGKVREKQSGLKYNTFLQGQWSKKKQKTKRGKKSSFERVSFIPKEGKNFGTGVLPWGEGENGPEKRKKAKCSWG